MILNVLVGLLLAILVYVVLTTFIVAQHIALIALVLAVLVFAVCAFGGVGARVRGRW